MNGWGHTSGRAFALLSLLLVSAPAGATVLIDSVEWAVADSDAVVRGRLAGLTRDAPPGEAGWATAEIEVLETIKGAPAPRLRVRCNLPDGRFGVEQWESTGGAERIVFLVTSSRRTRDVEEDARHPLALREDGWSLAPHPRKAGGVSRSSLAYTIDFRALRNEAQALAAVRMAVAEEPARGAEGRASVIIHAFAGSDAAEDFPRDTQVAVKAPLDARVERLAQAWALEPSRRQTARPVLQRLKSGRNAELLKIYLADPFHVRSRTKGKASTWHHFDRLAAYDTLREWGVDVAKPQVDQPADAYRPLLPLAAWGGAALLVLPMAVAVSVFVLRRRSALKRALRGQAGTAPVFGRSLFDVLALTLLLLALVATLVWRRSWSTVHEVTFSTSSGRHWVSSFRGRWQWVKIAGWEERAAPAYARFDLDASPAEPWTHDGVNVTGSGYRRGFSWLDGKPLYGTLGIGTALTYAAREAPAWLPAAVLAMIPLVRGASLLLAAARRRRRRARRRCPACGYDLRGGHDRCPECGQVATVSAALAKAAP